MVIILIQEINKKRGKLIETLCSVFSSIVVFDSSFSISSDSSGSSGSSGLFGDSGISLSERQDILFILSTTSNEFSMWSFISGSLIIAKHISNVPSKAWRKQHSNEVFVGVKE